MQSPKNSELPNDDAITLGKLVRAGWCVSPGGYEIAVAVFTDYRGRQGYIRIIHEDGRYILDYKGTLLCTLESMSDVLDTRACFPWVWLG